MNTNINFVSDGWKQIWALLKSRLHQIPACPPSNIPTLANNTKYIKSSSPKGVRKNGIFEDPKTKIICGMPKAKISSLILSCNIHSGFCQVRYEIEKQITKIANRHHTII